MTQTVTEAWPITSPTSSLHITNTVTCTENTTCKYELSFTTWTRHTAGPAWKTQRAEIPLQKTSITSQGTVIYHTALHYNIYTIPYILHYPTLFYCNVLYCTMQIPYCTMRRQSFGTKTRTGLDNREIGIWYPTRSKYFSFPQSVHRQPPMQWEPRWCLFYSWSKRSENETDNLPPSRSEVKSKWSDTSSTLYAFMAWRGKTLRYLRLHNNTEQRSSLEQPYVLFKFSGWYFKVHYGTAERKCQCCNQQYLK